MIWTRLHLGEALARQSGIILPETPNRWRSRTQGDDDIILAQAGQIGCGWIAYQLVLNL